jgi:hypothetical protein
VAGSSFERCLVSIGFGFDPIFEQQKVIARNTQGLLRNPEALRADEDLVIVTQADCREVCIGVRSNRPDELFESIGRRHFPGFDRNRPLQYESGRYWRRFGYM